MGQSVFARAQYTASHLQQLKQITCRQGLKTPALPVAGLKVPLKPSFGACLGGVFNPATQEPGTESPWRKRFCRVFDPQ